MTPDAFTLTHAELATLVARRVDALLTPEVIERLADEAIERQLGLLTWAQAARVLQCGKWVGAEFHPNKKQLQDFCRAHHIPVEYFTSHKCFIRRTEIEAALQRVQQRVPDPEAPTGTTIARLPDQRAQAA